MLPPKERTQVNPESSLGLEDSNNMHASILNGELRVTAGNLKGCTQSGKELHSVG